MGDRDKDMGSKNGLHIGLWIAQAFLAAAFVMAGGMKMLAPSAESTRSMGISIELIRFIGVAKLAGALGRILPAATRVKPGLTVLAGLGLATVMQPAAGFHVMRAESRAWVARCSIGGSSRMLKNGRFQSTSVADRAFSW